MKNPLPQMNVRSASPSPCSCLRLGLAASLLLACFQAAAATDSAPRPSTVAALQAPAPEGVTDLQQVQVQGERHDPRRDDTASRLVVGKDELVRHGDATLVDAIKRLPGVTVTTAAPGSTGSITLRGMGKGYTQVLVDGQAAPAGFDPGSLSPDMVERIEILRTATADMRAEAIAGTINIVLAKAARQDSSELKISLAESNGRSTPGINWSRSRRGEHRGYTVNAALSRRAFLVEEAGIEGGFSPEGVQDLHRSTNLRVEGFRDVLSLSPYFNAVLENGDTLGWQTFLEASNYNKHGDIGWQTQSGPELRHVRYRQSTGIDVVQLRTDLSWAREFDSGGTFTSKLGLGGNREDYRFREQGYGADGMQNLDEATHGWLRVRNFASFGKYTWPGSGAHVFEAGWEGSLDRRREARVQRLLAFDGIPEGFSDLSFDARVRRAAVYAQDEWTVTPAWSLYLGARWEQIETRSDGNGFEPIRNRSAILSPVLQSRWRLPDSKNQVRLGLSRTYRSPELRLLVPRPYTSTNNRELDPDTMGNPLLKPELATGVDLAYEAFPEDGATFSLGGYVRTIEDVIRTETRLVGDRWVAMPTNGGSATAWGIELDTRFSLLQTQDASGLELRFNLTRNWSRIDDLPGPDNRIDKQPSLSSTLAADYRFSPAWSVGASYSYRSGGSTRTGIHQIAGESARRELDAYMLVSLWGKARLRLGVANVLQQDIASNTEYFDASGRQRIERLRPTHLSIRANLEVAF
ncbi:TonB-dependent receptor plug domain-containing protein [Luteimonas sp. A501]